MVYLFYVSCLRYTILEGTHKFSLADVLKSFWALLWLVLYLFGFLYVCCAVCLCFTWQAGDDYFFFFFFSKNFCSCCK